MNDPASSNGGIERKLLSAKRAGFPSLVLNEGGLNRYQTAKPSITTQMGIIQASEMNEQSREKGLDIGNVNYLC